jgi:hypothetical protein
MLPGSVIGGKQDNCYPYGFLITHLRQTLANLTQLVVFCGSELGPSIQVIGIVLELGIGIRRITTPS